MDFCLLLKLLVKILVKILVKTQVVNTVKNFLIIIKYHKKPVVLLVIKLQIKLHEVLQGLQHRRLQRQTQPKQKI